MPFELRVRGLAEVNRNLARLGREAPQQARQALTEEAETVMLDAKRRTPVLTGALRASGHVLADPRKPEVKLVFGDAAVSYAVPVHENLEAHHEVGEAKFLERALLEALPTLVGRVARRLRELMGL
jgi:hypothetical protein